MYESCRAIISENQQLVSDELVEEILVEVQDCIQLLEV